MFTVFLMVTTIKIIKESVDSLSHLHDWRWWFELLAVTPVASLLLVVMFWMLFDARWLNLDDEEKESKWLTWRWIKFSPLLLMIALPFVSLLMEPKNAHKMVNFSLDSIVYFFAYVSLCVSHDRGFGRLFQPFAVMRTKEYIDDKGQKFECNIIGTMLNIIILGVPNWIYILREPAAHLVKFSLDGVKELDKVLGEIIADSLIVFMVLYVLGVMFLACVKVTFYLAQSRWNYLKFAPIMITPICVLMSKLIVHNNNGSLWSEKLGLCAYVFISIFAYFSLISPPDSLMAVFFQPFVPMLNTVSDLPESGPTKPHVKSNIVPPAEASDQPSDVQEVSTVQTETVQK